MLPASPGGFVVVTSRDRLVGLVARDGARPVPLEVLSPAEAIALLGASLEDRPGVEPAAVAQLAGCCAQLPLALRIAAANLVHQPPGTTVARMTTRASCPAFPGSASVFTLLSGYRDRTASPYPPPWRSIALPNSPCSPVSCASSAA